MVSDLDVSWKSKVNLIKGTRDTQVAGILPFTDLVIYIKIGAYMHYEVQGYTKD